MNRQPARQNLQSLRLYVVDTAFASLLPDEKSGPLEQFHVLYDSYA